MVNQRTVKFAGMRRMGTLLTFSATLLTLACGGSGNSSADTSPYVVGISTDLTGATSTVGVPLRDGMTTYFKYVSGHGGINGHPVQVIALDDQGKPELAIANLKQLSQQYHALALAGSASSSVQTALYPYLDQYQTIVVGKDTVSTDVSGPAIQKWVYQSSIVNALGITAQVDYALTLAKGAPVKFATLSAPTAGGLESRSRAETYAKSKGSTVVASINLPVTATDAAAQVSETINAKAEAVVSAHGDKYMILYVQGLRSRNSTIPVLNSPGGSALVTLQQLNDPGFYVLRGIAYSTDTSPGVKLMVSELKAAGLNPDTSSIGDGWLEAVVIGEGLRKCGDGCTGAKLRTAMENLDADTKGLTASNVKFSPTNHIGLQAGSIWHYAGGQPVKVADSLPFH